MKLCKVCLELEKLYQIYKLPNLNVSRQVSYYLVMSPSWNFPARAKLSWSISIFELKLNILNIENIANL